VGAMSSSLPMLSQLSRVAAFVCLTVAAPGCGAASHRASRWDASPLSSPTPSGDADIVYPAFLRPIPASPHAWLRLLAEDMRPASQVVIEFLAQCPSPGPNARKCDVTPQCMEEQISGESASGPTHSADIGVRYYWWRGTSTVCAELTSTVGVGGPRQNVLRAVVDDFPARVYPRFKPPPSSSPSAIRD
jgi:hypothetical protein